MEAKQETENGSENRKQKTEAKTENKNGSKNRKQKTGKRKQEARKKKKEKKMSRQDWSLETACVQAGYEPTNEQPRIVPLVQSTTFKYDSADEVAALFNLEKVGHMYSRISNPTVAALEEKINALEGGVGALATSSGQSATLLSILTIAHRNN